MRGPVRLPLEQLQPYLFAMPPTPAPLSWATVFGNTNPVEIEVGFGKGLFLVTAGQERPEVNFFGIEIIRKYQLFTANRLAKRELHNVRLACADARLFLRDYVPAGSVQAVHVYFPDPWWKKRHHKRRLFTAEFAAIVGTSTRRCPEGRPSSARTASPAWLSITPTALTGPARERRWLCSRCRYASGSPDVAHSQMG